jgi:hypothetical protein
MAKSKTKKLTFNMLAAEIQPNEPAMITVRGFEDQPIAVQKTLSLQQALAFIKNTVSMVIDTETGEYMPEVCDFALKLNVILSYADIPIPKDLEKAYKVVYESNLYDSVMNVINSEQYYILEDAVSDRVQYLRDMLVSGAAIQVNEMIKKMEDTMGDSLKTLNEFNSDSFLNALNSMQNVVSAADGEQSTEPEKMGEVVPFTKA